jgi:hypothetical protein
MLDDYNHCKLTRIELFKESLNEVFTLISEQVKSSRELGSNAG